MTAHLPLSRVRTIIKSSADVDVVGKESTFLVTRAAELFIKRLAKEAYKDTNKGKKLDYKNVANIVNNDNHYEFLREIIPKKISVREYYELMKKQRAQETSSDDSSDDDSSSSSSNSSNVSGGENSENDQNKDSSDSDCIMLD